MAVILRGFTALNRIYDTSSKLLFIESITLFQMKCGLKEYLGDLSFYGINLRILQTQN